MPLDATAVSARLRSVVHYSLDNFLHKNALFAAERLVAFDPDDDENRRLLAAAHYASGQPATACTVLLGTKSRACAYLRARCCFDLDRLVEGEAALRPLLDARPPAAAAKPPPDPTEERFDVRRCEGPDDAAVLYLLGQFYVKLTKPDKAADCFSRSAKLNPYNWSAFEALCKLGFPVDASEYFKPARGNATKRPKLNVADTRPPAADLETRVLEAVQARANYDRARDNYDRTRNNVRAPIKPPRDSQSSTAPLAVVSNVENNNKLGSAQAPTSRGAAVQAAPSRGATAQAAPSRGATAQAAPSRGAAAQAAPSRATAAQGPLLRSAVTHHQAAVVHTNLRSSGAPSAAKRSTVTEKRTSKQPVHKLPAAPRAASAPLQTKLPGTTAPLREKKRARIVSSSSSSARTAGVPASGAAKGDLAEVGDVAGPTSEQEAASTYILDLLATLGVAYAHMCQFRCAKALETFNELDVHQRETGWVMIQMATAEYEIHRLGEAEERFKRVHDLEPYRMEGMDCYSAVLFALYDDVGLSSLAHRLIEHDRRSPVGWVILAALFSFQKDHEKAISTLERAIQLEPSYAYAHVLLGHEYFDSEDFTKANLCYRRALQEDPLSYKAWYGVGMVYHHLGNDHLAEIHYGKAVEINPSNAMILHSLGTVQKRVGKLPEALRTLELAVKVNDKYWNTRLVKAAVHTELGNLDDAIKEVAAAKELAPTDGKVYMQMGRLYQHVGRKQDAIDEFGAAAVMDIKVSQAAHEAIEKLDSYDPEENEAGSIWEDVFKTIC